MKIKLTPLNIVSALSLATLLTLLVDKGIFLSPKNMELSGVFMAIAALVLVISFLCDQVFRKFIPTVGKLWVAQIMLIALTIVFVLILKVVLF